MTTHLLHEVKDELDWAERELTDAERKFTMLEKRMRERIREGEETSAVELERQLEEEKSALNMDELYAILSGAARRYSLLSRVFEIGAANNNLDDMVTAITKGLLFREGDDHEEADGAIAMLAKAMLGYFHVHLGDESDEKIRDAWLEVQSVLHKLGRKI